MERREGEIRKIMWSDRREGVRMSMGIEGREVDKEDYGERVEREGERRGESGERREESGERKEGEIRRIMWRDGERGRVLD